MIVVKVNSVVSLRYIMKNSRGEVLEDSMNASPTVYLHGSVGIQSYLQDQLAGLVAGERKNVFLWKSSGLTDDDYSFEVIIDAVRDALPEEVMLGYPVQAACKEDCECYRL